MPIEPSLDTFVFLLFLHLFLLTAAKELSPPVNVRPPLALRHDRRHGLVEHGGIDLQPTLDLHINLPQVLLLAPFLVFGIPKLN